MIILDKSAEQFAMTAKTDKFDDIACLINPYQQEIIFDMALYAPFVIANEPVWEEFVRYCSSLCKAEGNFFQSF